ncbi:hypothetical protein MKX03_026894 [Papaver bracteatum]|nr:hypothetical protein MKX03_026894 [Papaver bracteatum]
MMEFRDGRHDSNNLSMTKSETTLSESDLLTPSKKSGSSYSHSSPSSSSSGSSFDEDFFQLEGTKDNTSQTGTLKLGENTHSALTNGHDKEDIPIIVFSPKSQVSDLGSLGPASPRYASSGLVKQSPPIQVMGRTDNFENSYRIPSSVFSRSKSTTPQDWSVASNESLFSIHVGNNSFSREQMAFLGKSGELVYPLTKSGELVFPPLNKSGELKSLDSKSSGELVYSHNNSGELISYQASAPQVSTVVKSENDTLNLGEELGVTEAAAETMKEVLRVTAEDRYKETTPTEAVRISFSISPRSDESGTSIHSFAFPILIAGDRGKSSSAKTDPELQQLEQHTPSKDIPAPPNTLGSRWFSCFSCCHICKC